MVVELGLGKWQGHAVIAEEHHDRVISMARVLEGLQDGADRVIRPSNGAIVEGEFLADVGMIKEESRDWYFLRLEHTGDLVRVIGFPEGLVGVGDVDIQAERFPGSLGFFDAAESTLSVR